MSCQSVKAPRNNRVKENEWNAQNGVVPPSSRQEIYSPPPAYPPESIQTLNLAREVHNNMLKVQQLAAAATLRKQMLLLANQNSQDGPLDVAAMNPNSEYSVSIVKAALDVLQRTKLSSSSMTVTNQFMSMLNASGSTGHTQPAVPKGVRRASAA